MSTFILVPGAWLGAWSYREVADLLRGRGHTVYPLSLTGLGERTHLGSATVDLDTHIADIVNLVDAEELDGAILVGHSYAGMLPVPGAAHRLGDRVSHVVYLDSAPLSDGMAMVDMMPPDTVAALTEQVRLHGDGWRHAFPSFAELGESSSLKGLDEVNLDRLRRKASDHPFGSYTRALSLRGDPPPSSLIACEDMRKLLAAGIPLIAEFATAVRHRVDVDTGHWPMLSAPEAVSAALHRISESTKP